MPADRVFEPEELYEATSIADWILPLVRLGSAVGIHAHARDTQVYAGHVGHVVWVKPEWAEQMQDGVYTFAVGQCSRDGGIKVTLFDMK